MNHPTIVWYLAQARQDDLMRELARPRLPRPDRPERQGLVEWVTARLHRTTPTPAVQAADAGCGLPMGCAA